MRKPPKNYTPEEKVAILRRHLVEHIPVSDLCDQYRLSPTIFYNWQIQFFENGTAAFERPKAGPEKEQERRRRAIVSLRSWQSLPYGVRTDANRVQMAIQPQVSRIRAARNCYTRRDVQNYSPP